MKIAICQNKNMWNHPHTFSANNYIERCKERAEEGVEFEIVDPYASDAINIIKEFDGLIWNFQNYLGPTPSKQKTFFTQQKEWEKLFSPITPLHGISTTKSQRCMRCRP